MMHIVIFIAYSVWAIYSGYKYMDGRVAYFEEDGIPNKVLKVISSIFVGYLIGCFTFISMVFGFVRMILKI